MKLERFLLFVSLILNVCLLILVRDTQKDVRYVLDRSQRLDREVELLEGMLPAYNREEIPTITTYCARGAVNGPAEVPFEHPVLEISGAVSAPGFWLEMQVANNWGGANYILSVFGAASPWYDDVFDGYIRSSRGNQGPHILNPDDTYILRGWRYPYTTEDPVFEPRDLLFEMRISMPDCEATSRLGWNPNFLVYEKVAGHWEFRGSMELTEREVPVTMPTEGQWCVVNIEALTDLGEDRALEFLCEVSGTP